MSETEPSTLSEIHELPWSEIAGAHVVVRHDHEHREGDLIGRAIGSGLYYDTQRGETVADQIGPAVFLHTADDTVLEVSTEKSGNELLSFEVESEVDHVR